MPRTPITAYRLRELAEEADGLRGQPLELVFEKDDLVLKAPSGTIVSGAIPVQTPKQKDPYSVKLRAVNLDPAPKLRPGDENLAESFDAFFWSESAVDKFLVPYYVRMHGADFVKELQDAIRNKFVYLISHYPRTVAGALGTHDFRILAPPSPDLIESPEFMTLEEWRRTKSQFEGL
jgi:hypothetical protein